MTETLTSPLLTRTDAWPEFVPAGHVFLNCDTLATSAEMAAAGNACRWCAKVMTSKVGDGLVAGTMIGVRASASDEWTWSGPFCQKCDRAHGRLLD